MTPLKMRICVDVFGHQTCPRGTRQRSGFLGSVARGVRIVPLQRAPECGEGNMYEAGYARPSKGLDNYHAALTISSRQLASHRAGSGQA